MEILPMDLMPPPGSDWERRRIGDRIKLEITQQNPLTGATTTWSKDLKDYRESRMDKISGSSWERYISRRVRPGKTPENPAYVIEKHDNGQHRSMRLQPSSGLLPWKVELYAADEPGQELFFATYNGSDLYEMRIRHKSINQMSVFQSQEEQSLPDNLRALAQICRREGAVSAFNPEMGPVHDELNADQKDYLDWVKDESKREADKSMKAWSKSERKRAMFEVIAVVSGTVNEHLRGDYSQEEIDTLAVGLMNKIISDLPFDFNTKADDRQRIEEINDSLVINTAQLLASNICKYEELGDSSISFYFGQDNKNEVGLVIADADGIDIFQRGSLRFGGKYRYQEHDYGISKDPEGKIIAIVAAILRPNPKSRFMVPEQIDLQEFVRHIRVPESVGWEKALDLVDFGISRY